MENKFTILMFFSIVSLLTTAIFSIILVSQNRALNEKLEQSLFRFPGK